LTMPRISTTKSEGDDSVTACLLFDYVIARKALA
jgi:hypothetical protein